MSQTSLKVGVVGMGKMGALHLQKYLKAPGAQVVGFYEPDAATARRIFETHGVSAIDSLPELFFECDAVTIASPTATHFSLAKQALEAGVHVLVEKPVTETEAQARELIQLARSRGLVLQVGFIERFRYLALSKNFCLDPVRFIETHRMSASLGRETNIDVVTDLMIHDLDLVLSLVREEPLMVSAIGVPVLTSHFDIANVRLEFPGGAVANLNASRVSVKPQRKFRVFSLSAYASLDFISNGVDVYFRNERREIEHRNFEGVPLDALQLQTDHFLGSVREGVQPLVTGEDGLLALKYARIVRERINERGAWKTPGLSPEENLPA